MGSLKDLQRMVAEREARGATSAKPAPTAAEVWDQKRKEGMSAKEATEYCTTLFGPPPAPPDTPSFNSTKRLMLREIGNAVARCTDAERELRDILERAQTSALASEEIEAIDHALRAKALTQIDYAKNAIKRARGALVELATAPITVTK